MAEDIYSNLFEDNTSKDVTFVIRGHKLKAHKMVLAFRCNYFRQLFEQKKENKIKVGDTSFKLFNEVVKFCYFQKIDLKQWRFNEKCHLLDLAKKYKYRPLMNFVKLGLKKCPKEPLNALGSCNQGSETNHFLPCHSKANDELFLKSISSDVTFVVDSEEVPGHRSILKASCPYLDEVLNSDLEALKSKRFHITGTSAKIFKEMMRFIYLKHLEIVNWNIEELLELLSLADDCEFSQLFSQVVKALELQPLDIHSWTSLNSAADVHESKELRQKCVSFAEGKIDDFLGLKDLETFTVELICCMFTSSKVSTINQDKLFTAIRTWKQNQNLHQIILLFKKINWKNVSHRISVLILKDVVTKFENAHKFKFWNQLSADVKQPSKYIGRVDSVSLLESQCKQFTLPSCQWSIFCAFKWFSLGFFFKKDDPTFELPVRRIEFELPKAYVIDEICGFSKDLKEMEMAYSEPRSNNGTFKYSAIFSSASPVCIIYVSSEQFKHISEIQVQNIVIY